MSILITPPCDFRYLPTIYSHGWCVLLPNSYNEATKTLSRVQALHDGSIVRLTICPLDDGWLQVDADRALTPPQSDEIRAVVGRMLAFDWDVQVFYEALRAHPRYAWVERIGAGRMLVSPTVWEDLAKTLLTTNTTWAMTKSMAARLTALGSGAGDLCAFPAPEQVAAYTPEALNERVRAGYRGAYLHALASVIADGSFDAEALRDPALPSTEVYRRLKSLKGFGAYAIGAMMRLLGRFDELGIDSVVRTMFKRHINSGAAATDREIAAYYEPLGQWRGLAVWLDVMREDLPEA